MSKSPRKDFSRLIETNVKTAKKEEIRRDELLYPSYQPRYQPTMIVSDLKTKLDAALRQNTRLLDENSTLSEMTNDLRFQLKQCNEKYIFFQRQSEQVLRRTANERENLLTEVNLKQKSHEQEMAKLLRQISNLHEQKNNLEIGRQKQIQKLKDQFQSSLLTQLQNVRSCQNNSKDLYETQLRNLKDIIDEKQYEIENIKAVEKLQKNRLSDNIKALQKEIKHIKHANSIELQSLKNQFEADLNGQRRRFENEKDLEIGGVNLKLRRLKKDILQKNIELEMTAKKMSHQEEAISIESTQFKKQKETLLSELKGNDMHAKNILTKQKNKLEELNKLQVQNLNKLFQTNMEERASENTKLKQLIESKKEELKNLYDENQRIKESYDKQNVLIKSTNNELKNKIRSLQLENKQEIQAFKIKMANLLENDVKCMSDYYENQLKVYIEKVREQEKINAGIKERLFKALLDNDELRKNFEIEVAKQRARVQDLKIKMAAIHLEHKQHVSNLGSKIQLTSQTLIRETEHKQKSKGQYEEEIRKYQYLVATKDKQIGDLMAMVQNVKKLHQQELKTYRAEIMQYKQELDEKEQQMYRTRIKSEEELKQKQDRLRAMVFNNQKELQQIKELQDKIQVLQKNNLKIKKQMEHYQLINASIAQQLGLSKGFIESLQLESNAAIEDERSKLKTFLGTHEISIKEYFEDKIKSKEKDIDSLKRLLSEKEDDIRELIVKYNALEKRMDIMLQTQSKVRQFQQKIKHLGLDNNLVKNMAELFKK